MEAVIAQWIHLCLPSCGPGFEYQAHHLRFFHFVIELSSEQDENQQKEARKGHKSLSDMLMM